MFPLFFVATFSQKFPNIIFELVVFENQGRTIVLLLRNKHKNFSFASWKFWCRSVSTQRERSFSESHNSRHTRGLTRGNIRDSFSRQSAWSHAIKPPNKIYTTFTESASAGIERDTAVAGRGQARTSCGHCGTERLTRRKSHSARSREGQVSKRARAYTSRGSHDDAPRLSRAMLLNGGIALGRDGLHRVLPITSHP